MSASTIPIAEPAPEPKPGPETPATARRPLVELLPTGTARILVGIAMLVAAIASFLRFGLHGQALVGAVLCPALILLTAIDLEHRLLPNTIVLPASIAIGAIVAVSTPGDFLSHLAAAAALSGFFFVFALFLPGSLGMGDVKLGFLLGIALGPKTLGAALIAIAALFVAALYVLATRGISARRDALPFGPFLALGGIVAFFLG